MPQLSQQPDQERIACQSARKNDPILDADLPLRGSKLHAELQ
jgi:hypothetical protein